ncbi:unnamed protein product, partial [Amoebophrya sp. A25]
KAVGPDAPVVPPDHGDHDTASAAPSSAAPEDGDADSAENEDRSPSDGVPPEEGETPEEGEGDDDWTSTVPEYPGTTSTQDEMEHRLRDTHALDCLEKKKNRKLEHLNVIYKGSNIASENLMSTLTDKETTQLLKNYVQAKSELDNLNASILDESGKEAKQIKAKEAEEAWEANLGVLNECEYSYKNELFYVLQEQIAHEDSVIQEDASLNVNLEGRKYGTLFRLLVFDRHHVHEEFSEGFEKKTLKGDVTLTSFLMMILKMLRKHAAVKRPESDSTYADLKSIWETMLKSYLREVIEELQAKALSEDGEDEDKKTANAENKKRLKHVKSALIHLIEEWSGAGASANANPKAREMMKQANNMSNEDLFHGLAQLSTLEISLVLDELEPLSQNDVSESPETSGRLAAWEQLLTLLVVRPRTSSAKEQPLMIDAAKDFPTEENARFLLNKEKVTPNAARVLAARRWFLSELLRWRETRGSSSDTPAGVIKTEEIRNWFKSLKAEDGSEITFNNDPHLRSLSNLVRDSVDADAGRGAGASISAIGSFPELLDTYDAPTKNDAGEVLPPEAEQSTPAQDPLLQDSEVQPTASPAVEAPAADPKQPAEAPAKPPVDESAANYFTEEKYAEIWAGTDFWNHVQQMHPKIDWTPKGVTAPPPRDAGSLRGFVERDGIPPTVQEQIREWIPDSFPGIPHKGEKWAELCKRVLDEDHPTFLRQPSNPVDSAHPHYSGKFNWKMGMAWVLHLVITEFLYQVAYPWSLVASHGDANPNSIPDGVKQSFTSYTGCLRSLRRHFLKVLSSFWQPYASHIESDKEEPFGGIYLLLRTSVYDMHSPQSSVLFYANNPDIVKEQKKQQTAEQGNLDPQLLPDSQTGREFRSLIAVHFKELRTEFKKITE